MNTDFVIDVKSHMDHLDCLTGQEWHEVVHPKLQEAWRTHDAQGSGPWVLTVDVGLDLPCDLIGPTTGLLPVDESEVRYFVRLGRKCATRSVKRSERAMVRTFTLVVGPYEGKPHVLYTVYPGPAAPREPGDHTIGTWEELQASREFWSQHALRI